MARKIVNRKALREEVEAAEKAEAGEEKVAKRKPAKRKSRKEAVEVRKRLVWKVCNQSSKPVGQSFPYHQEEEARKKAAALTASTKQQHYVQKCKEEIEVP